MTDVSVVGLGVMGSALARTLLGSGYSVTVWNRSAEKIPPLTEAGAVPAKTVAEAVSASPATITCIGSHDQTRALLEDVGDGLSGKTLIKLGFLTAVSPERGQIFKQHARGMLDSFKL